MQGLGATLAALKRARTRHDADAQGQMNETFSFGDNPGELRMLSFVPAGLKQGASLVVVLHGCTQRAEPHAHAAGWLALAQRCGFAVLTPEQRTANNINRCFNWFEPGDTARGHGEAASIRAMIAHMIDAHALDAGRVYITGLSAGGAMTSVMLGSYPEVFAGGAIVAGLPFGAADSVEGAFRAMRGGGRGTNERSGVKPSADARLPRVVIWHGDADYTVNAANAEQIARQWLDAHAVPFEAGQSEAIGRRERTFWRATNSDEIVVESNIVRGLGHGTPLATLGERGVGVVAPYMIEADISAASEIVRFWKLADADLLGEGAPAEAEISHDDDVRLADTILASVSGRVTADVEAVIADALRQAGLMGSVKRR